MTEIILTEQTLAFEYNSDRGAYVNNSNPSLFLPVEGEAYIVSWDGTEYTCVAFTDDTYAGMVLLGNTLFLGGTDTGEPFIFASTVDGSGMTIFTTETTESHLIGVQHEISDDKQILVPQQLLLGFVDGAFQADGTIAQLVIGNEYLAFWDGTVYNCVAQDPEPGSGLVVLGNLSFEDSTYPDTGEPFMMILVPAEVAGNDSGVTAIVTDSTSVGHHVALYQIREEEETFGASIILYDDKGTPTTYEGADKVQFPTTDGGTQIYTCGQLPAAAPEIPVNFANGDQTVSVDKGYLVREAILKKPEQLLPENIIKDIDIAGVVGQFEIIEEVEVGLNMAEGNQEAVAYGALQAVKKVIIVKPETMIPENIAEGVDIAGVVGVFKGGTGVHKDVEPDFSEGDITVTPDDEDTLLESVTIKKPAALQPANIVSGVNIAGIVGEYEAPKLYAPTAVTGPTENTATGLYYYQVANPTANNGAFVDTVQVRNADNDIITEVACAGATTKIYASDFTEINSVILSNFYASLAGDGFSPSDTYDANTNIYAIQIFEYDLQNVTLDSQPKRAYQQDKITVVAVASDGYYLPKNISLLLNDGTTASFNASYDPDTGIIVYEPLSYNFTEGIITVSVIAVDMPWLRNPTILGLDDNGLLSIEYANNSEVLLVYYNGEEIAQISGLVSAPTCDSAITEKPSGATYGFSVASDGYYTSSNKGINNSYSICRIDVTASADVTLLLDCINYAESNYDFGLISKLDTSLTFSYTADSSVFKSFKGASSSSVVRIEYPVTAGEHYFYIKYRKDSSSHSGNDAFKFKIVGIDSAVEQISTLDVSAQLMSNYGTHEFTVVATAEGYTDSDAISTSVELSPVITVDDGVLTVINTIPTPVTAFEVYFDDVLAGTVAYDGSEGFSISLQDFADAIGIKNRCDVYVRGIGNGLVENKSNVIENIWPMPMESTPIYGVAGMYASEPTLTRTDDAVGKTYVINEDGTVQSDFDSLFPWSEAELVTDGKGNYFVQMPEMYFRVTTDDNYRITDIAVSPYAHSAGTWYKVEPFCYGRYNSYFDSSNSNTSYWRTYSKPGVSPVGTYKGNYRSAAKKHGDGYQLIDLYHQTVMQFLWWIEWATKNAYSVMTGCYGGSGTTGGTAKIVCGITDSLSTPSGYESTRNAMRWHYIENFVGGYSQYIDGAILTGASENSYASADPATYLDTTDTSSAIAAMGVLAYTNPAAAGCTVAYGWDPANPFLCLPCETTEDTTFLSYFCSKTEAFDGTKVIPLVCSNYNWSYAQACSGFHMPTRAAGTSYANFQTRLLYAGTL